MAEQVVERSRQVCVWKNQISRLVQAFHPKVSQTFPTLETSDGRTHAYIAISRRMQTDRSGIAGPRSDGTGEAHQRGRRGNNNHTRGGHHHQHENNTPSIQVPPTVPSFGFQLPAHFTMPQALAMPPGYSMLNGQQSSNNGGS